MSDNGGGGWLVVGLLALALWQCSGDSDSTSDEEASLYEEADTDEATIGLDGDERGGENWHEYDERRDAVEEEAGSFSGDGCTEDCSGHSAGYDWAAQRGIDDPDDCGGNSWSFEEGCRAYAEEQ